ncbi:hypothetical protein Moror_15355 [Moniliophthora roreri MCA 2997]|uniref:RING-type domain-containing protein n=1 Tax=Moniliophthora roreri (strain MCA 2997) TaxID=1381753 RepID=V2X1V3_MONRO|nr:hypothetical protein Moror_15355 [Moniliophthora roreri MCA 2997]
MSKQKYTSSCSHQVDWEREDAINVRLNLGAESPDSVLKDEFNYDQKYPADDWTRSGLAVYTNVPERPRTWRSNSFSEKQKRRPAVSVPVTEDMDCGICFMNSVSPSKTLCCGKFFCYEHIVDWLTGPAADGRCPECTAPCNLKTDIHFYDLKPQHYISTSSPTATPVINSPARIASVSHVKPSPRQQHVAPAAVNDYVVRKAAEKKSDKEYQKMLGMVGFAMAIGYRAASQGLRL